jgi:hypothetical protein
MGLAPAGREGKGIETRGTEKKGHAYLNGSSCTETDRVGQIGLSSSLLRVDFDEGEFLFGWSEKEQIDKEIDQSSGFGSGPLSDGHG